MKHLTPSIEQARTACLDFVNSQFDQLLEKVKSSADFLAEMNATNDHEPQGEYKVSMLVQSADETPQIPTDAELDKALEKPEVKELEKRFDLEQTGEAEPTPATFQQELSWELVLPDDERFTKIVG